MKQIISGPIHALIFDAEGVVIDTMRTVWIPADIEFCRRRGFPCPNELLIKLAGTNLLDGVRIFKAFHNFDGDDQALLQERLDLATELFKNKVTFVPGFLEFFKQYNYLPSAIATSLRSEYLEIVNQRLELNALFKNHVYSIYGAKLPGKPNPDIFLYAAKQLGAEPKNCVVFEDAPNGIAAAKAAGMRCVAITTSFPRELLQDATIIIDSFSEIWLNDPQK